MLRFMNAFFKYFISDKTIFVGSIFSFLVILFTLFYILITYSHLPPYLPVFNQMPWGNARITTREYIFLPLLVSTVIFFSNFTLSFFIYTKIPLIARILIFTNLLVCSFMFLFIARIIQLII